MVGPSPCAVTHRRHKLPEPPLSCPYLRF
jgi:hypothetical protein